MTTRDQHSHNNNKDLKNYFSFNIHFYKTGTPSLELTFVVIWLILGKMLLSSCAFTFPPDVAVIATTRGQFKPDVSMLSKYITLSFFLSAQTHV